MATLTGTTIQSTYDSLLKVTDNDSITGSLKRITDGLGNNTPLYLSSSAVEIVSALNVIGNITATNLSGTNTGDETKASIESKLGAATSSNSGYLTSTDWSTFNNKIAGSGTLNKLAKFSSSSSIADSTITDTGSAVTIGVATTVSGNLTASALIKSGGTASQILAADGSVITAGTNITISGGTISSSGGISGSGTTNTIPKFTGSTAIGNSNITDTGSLITLGSNSYINGQLGIGTSSLGVTSLTISLPLENSATIYGVLNNGVAQSTATNAVNYFGTTSNTAAGSYTIPIIRHYIANGGTFGAGSVVSTQVGYDVNSTLNGATTNYGFRGRLAAATGVWNLYMDGTADNYIAGSLGIGSTSLTGYTLRVAKNITGSTASYGMLNSGVVQSDVTSSAFYYRSLFRTAAAAFTLTNAYHFYASQDTLGAGSTVTTQSGFEVSSNVIGATNNYGFKGSIPAGTGRFNLYMDGTADNYLAGNIGIGGSQLNVSAGPILTTTLTNGGSGYVDGTYTEVASTVSAGSGTGALFNVIVSGGVVTSATLFWSGSNYRAGDIITISNTLLGGTGSGLVITVATVDLSQLKITGVNGGDITLNRNDTSLAVNDNIGSIKFESNDISAKSSGLQARISAYGAGSFGGAYLSFFTRSATGGSSLVEGMRVTPEGNVFLPTTALGIGSSSLTGINLRVERNITGATVAYGIFNSGTVQSDVTGSANYFISVPATQATAFTLGTLRHYQTDQGTFGAGSVVTTQVGFNANSTLIGATNNYGFRGQIASGTNRWNLYMDGTANNYMAGALGIGSTSLATTSLRISRNGTGGTQFLAIDNQTVFQSDVTVAGIGYNTFIGTQATAFTLAEISHFRATQGTIGAGSTVTTQVGFNVSSGLIGGTNNYGFRGSIPSGTGRFNLYMDGTAGNYLAGDLAIGTTTLTSIGGHSGILTLFGSNATAISLQDSVGRKDIRLNDGNLDITNSAGTSHLYVANAGGVGIGSTTLTGFNLNIARNLTGAVTSRGIQQAYTVQSDVTNAAIIYSSAVSTQATAFTLPQLTHYFAGQGTIGAGSTVTDQHGFRVESSLIGATNNYGFRGQIAAGTGRWNLYMDGTANNYLAGNTAIGTTSPFSSAGYATLTVGGGAGILGQIVWNSGTTPIGYAYNDATNMNIGSDAALIFRTTASATERMRIFSGGNVAIGSSTDNNTGAKLQVTGGMTYQNLFNRRTASYTLTINDQNYIVEMNVGSANNLTIPPNSSVALPIGTEIAIIQYGAGQTTIVAGAGVTLRSKSNALKISGQYAGCTCVKVGTDEWYVIGDLTL